jgi:hypothetical protein
VREGEVGRLEGERLVDRGDCGAAQRRDRFQGPLLREIPTNDLVDLVDLDRRNE